MHKRHTRETFTCCTENGDLSGSGVEVHKHTLHLCVSVHYPKHESLRRGGGCGMRSGGGRAESAGGVLGYGGGRRGGAFYKHALNLGVYVHYFKHAYSRKRNVFVRLNVVSAPPPCDITLPHSVCEGLYPIYCKCFTSLRNHPAALHSACESRLQTCAAS